MIKDISKLSHNALANRIERLSSVVDKASAPIWNAALHGNERWNDIVARLGESDPRVARYRAALALVDDAYYEAHKRCGPVTFNSLYPIVLRDMGRRRVK